MSNRKRQVFEELLDEVRRSQNATDRYDQAVADAIGLNRTDMRCLDIIDREEPVTAGRLAEAMGLTSSTPRCSKSKPAAGPPRNVRLAAATDAHDPVGRRAGAPLRGVPLGLLGPHRPVRQLHASARRGTRAAASTSRTRITADSRLR